MNGSDKQQINGFVVKAFASGPDRVVTHTEGGEVKHATSWERASQMEIYPDVVFVREDGWTLGATYEMAIPARRLWQADGWRASISGPRRFSSLKRGSNSRGT